MLSFRGVPFQLYHLITQGACEPLGGRTSPPEFLNQQVVGLKFASPIRAQALSLLLYTLRTTVLEGSGKYSQLGLSEIALLGQLTMSWMLRG